jgi:hypothetical protein
MLELSSDGRPVTLGSTGTHEARVKPMIPSLGATQLTEIPLVGKRSLVLVVHRRVPAYGLLLTLSSLREVRHPSSTACEEGWKACWHSLAISGGIDDPIV